MLFKHSVVGHTALALLVAFATLSPAPQSAAAASQLAVPLARDSTFLASFRSPFGPATELVVSEAGAVSFSIPIGRIFTQASLADAISRNVLPARSRLALAVASTGCAVLTGITLNNHAVQFAPQRIASGSSRFELLLPTSALVLPRFPDQRAGVVLHRPTALENLVVLQWNGCDIGAPHIRVREAALTINTAVRPILLIHGWMGANNSLLDFYRFAQADGLPVALPQSYNRGLDSIPQMAATIVREAARVRTLYGVDQIDIVAHSKGGLAVRAAQAYGPIFTDHVDRVIMLSTPNHGTNLMLVAALARCHSRSNESTFAERCWHSAGELLETPIHDSMNFSGCWPFASGLAGCSARSETWAQPSIRYFSIGGPLSALDIGANATPPWQTTVDATFPLAHEQLRRSRDVYACAISFIDPQIYPPSRCKQQAKSVATVASSKSACHFDVGIFKNKLNLVCLLVPATPITSEKTVGLLPLFGWILVLLGGMYQLEQQRAPSNRLGARGWLVNWWGSYTVARRPETLNASPDSARRRSSVRISLALSAVTS